MEQFLVLLGAFVPVFTAPSFENFKTLVFGAVLAPRSRTVTELIRAVGSLAPKSYATYSRFLSRATWNPWNLARILTGLVLTIVPGSIKLVVDDTTTRRWGPKVFGKGCHRDAVRSSQTYTVHCYGHKWVTLAILVKLPFCERLWALPILSLLYLSKDHEPKRRHRTLIELALILLYRLKRWFPNREFQLVGDGGYASVQLANWCRRLEITLHSRLRKDAVLYDPPPPRKKGQRGRPAKKGKRQPSFTERVADPETQWEEGEVAWYGGKRRRVRWTSGTGIRYSPSQPVVLIRWVIVVNPVTNAWESFFSTDEGDEPRDIIESYVERWSLEVTFEEVRRHAGLETVRNWCASSVQRTVPCLFGLFSLVAVWAHLAQDKIVIQGDPWYRKPEPTFSDALTALRQELWGSLFFYGCGKTGQSVEIPAPVFRFLRQRLARAG